MIDYDSLVQPIETARTRAEARAAVWGILRGLKRCSWWQREHELRDVMAAIDAAAWQAGLSEAFRAQAISPAYASIAQDIDGYQVIPDDCTAAFYVR